MTRVNVVEPSTLHREHLMGEIHEITRVFGYARLGTKQLKNAYQWGLHKKPPAQFVLGRGHVLFFVDKLNWVVERYNSLCDEWRSRGYNVKQISKEDLLRDIDKSFLGSYNPTQEAITLSQSRINERLKSMGRNK